MDVAGCYLFNTSHTGLENKGYAALLRRWGARPIFVVHDLIPVTHLEYCGLGARERHKARIHNALTMGCGIIANSHDTLDALKRFSNEAGLRLPPVVVARSHPACHRRPQGHGPLRGRILSYLVI